MKKILLNLILTIIMLSSAVYASDNSLNAVILEGTSKGYNLILRSDKVTNVKKTVLNDGTLVVDLKNISTSLNLDTRYLNTKDVNNMVVENAANNEVKIYVQAKDAQKTDVIFETPASAPVVVSDGLSKKEFGWIAVAFVLICAFAGSFRHSVEKDVHLTLQNDLTEREIKMYKDMKSEILVSAKIDNRLREQRAIRNMSNSTRHTDTIRNLQKMSLR